MYISIFNSQPSLNGYTAERKSGRQPIENPCLGEEVRVIHGRPENLRRPPLNVKVCALADSWRNSANRGQVPNPHHRPKEGEDARVLFGERRVRVPRTGVLPARGAGRAVLLLYADLRLKIYQMERKLEPRLV